MRTKNINIAIYNNNIKNVIGLH